MVEVLGTAGWVQQLQLQRHQSPQLDAEYPESIEDSVSKSAPLFDSVEGERKGQRMTKIYHFQFESCLALAVLGGCLKRSVLEKGCVRRLS